MARLLNYSTSIDVNRTIGEITGILVAHNANGIAAEYKNQEISSLSFRVHTLFGEMSFRLPARSESVAKIMREDNLPGWNKAGQPQRVAWRIIKDWVAAQMALIDVEMVRMEEVFLPYLIAPTGKTFYETMIEGGFKMLPGGKP